MKSAKSSIKTWEFPPNCSRRPVMIVPGFMSSGLEVEESSLVPRWASGKQKARLWLSLHRLGFSGRMLGTTGEIEVNNNASCLTSEDAEGIRMKNDWLMHMTLMPDLSNERDGVKVRAVKGLRGVDYLEPGALTNAASYVFGPVIKALVKRGGYTEEKDLDAAPYDWRVSPKVLEERDGYFTETLDRIERMRELNGLPVVLLCHSMGCLTGHYLLSFAEKTRGRAWIDVNISTYLPVGAPHLGAASSVPSIIVGNNMGLPTAFLSSHSALIMGRSLGSALWLMPVSSDGAIQDEVTNKIMCKSLVKSHSVLTLTLESIDLRAITAKHSNLSKMRLRIKVDGSKFYTPWIRALTEAPTPQTVTFEFAMPPNLGCGDDAIEIQLQERGVVGKAKYTTEQARGGTDTSCYGCFGMVKSVSKASWAGTLEGVNQAAKAVDSGVVICSTKYTALQLVGNDYVQSSVVRKSLDLGAVSNIMALSRKNSTCIVNCTISWSNAASVHAASGVKLPKKSDSKELLKPVSSNVAYDQYPPIDLLKFEQVQPQLALWEESYGNDPHVNTDCPPVDTVYAIYGVNVTTEIGSVFKRASRRIEENKLQPQYVLDTSAKLHTDVKTLHHYQVKSGFLFETKNTPNFCLVNNKEIPKCGDGTVPLSSLQHCITWKKQTTVLIKELENAEHRAILANAEFHLSLLDYFTLSADEVTAIQAKMKERADAAVLEQAQEGKAAEGAAEAKTLIGTEQGESPAVVVTTSATETSVEVKMNLQPVQDSQPAPTVNIPQPVQAQ